MVEAIENKVAETFLTEIISAYFAVIAGWQPEAAANPARRGIGNPTALPCLCVTHVIGAGALVVAAGRIQPAVKGVDTISGFRIAIVRSAYQTIEAISRNSDAIAITILYII